MDGKQSNGIAWDGAYSLGNALIDEQHKELIGILNKCVEACEAGNELSTVEETVEFLLVYIVKHFSEEEALQKEWAFPGYEAHKKIHEEITAAVNELVRKFKEQGSTKELYSSLQRVVIKWVLDHIMIEDKKIALHIEAVKNKTF